MKGRGVVLVVAKQPSGMVGESESKVISNESTAGHLVQEDWDLIEKTGKIVIYSMGSNIQ